MVQAYHYFPFRGRVYVSLTLSLVAFLTTVHLLRQRFMPRPPLTFEVQLTQQEQASLLQTVDVCTSTLSKASVPFFMTSGTLLGSWRHHGKIPWDDDVDFALLFVQRDRILQVLSRLQPAYILSTVHPKRWKLFPADGTDIQNVPWKFPFVDLNFFLINDTHIWDEDVINYPSAVFAQSEVFPLTLRPFQGRQLPAPANTRAVLEKEYDLEMCQTIQFYHRHETGDHLVKTFPCRQLMAKFPFVHRVPVAGGGCNETLLLNGRVLSWQAFPDQLC